jgi:hypothetical protein
MLSHCTFRSIRASTIAAALAIVISSTVFPMVLSLALATAATAADAIFPPGSRVGLVPPPGMVPSNTFDGFADPEKDAAILITVLPAAAYSQFEKTMDTDVLKKQGVSLEKREPIKLDSGKGFLLSGRQVADKTRYRKWLLVVAADDLTVLVTVQAPEQETIYSDRIVRAALATLSVRSKVPEAEELGLLPFAVADLAGFHIDGILRGRVLMLSDSHRENPEDAAKGALLLGGSDARLLIAALPSGPIDPNDHANFARLAFNEIGGIRDVHVTMSEPLRIGGQSGYQTMAEAKDARNGADIRVVQWLRFGGGGFMQMIGVGPADTWTSVLSRLRTVRDSVEPK